MKAALLAPLLFALLAACVTPAVARCVDENAPEAPPPIESAASAAEAERPAAAPADPRGALLTLVREAVERSQAIGAAKLLAQAAELEIGEARAAGLPQASLTGTVGPSATRVDGVSDSGTRVAAALNLSAPLFDAGRVQQLTSWRTELAEAARQGEIGLAEQVSLQTVSLALERSRYRLQEQVYQQYGRKMSCLVDVLQTIVDSDKGRGSELVQAKKTLEQVQLAAEQTRSAMRQIEVRLMRFVGPQLPSAAGTASVIVAMPPMNELLAEADRSSEISQLVAQANAADSYSRAVAAGQKPQVNWSITGARAAGAGVPSSSVGVAVSLNVPLLDSAARYSAGAAQKRAAAAHLQVADAIEGRRARIAEVYEQAGAAFQRAVDVAGVLKMSDRVRNDTLQQWRQIGRRSLFDVMSAESDHYGLRIAYVNALHDAQQSTALLWSLGLGVSARLQ